MINSGKFQDHAKFLKFAGKSSNMQGDCVEKCIKPQSNNGVKIFYYR